MEFFRPYEGTKPFFFISYSHKNSGFVLDILRPLRDANYRLWYDEGIPAGSDWPQNIAEHMRRCSAVLFFRSETALASPNCFNEIKAALDQGKTILQILLDDSQPDSAWLPLLHQAEVIPIPGTGAEAARMLMQRQELAPFAGENTDYEAGTAGGRRAGILDILIAFLLIALLGIGSAVFLQWKRNNPPAPETVTHYVTRQESVPELDLGQWQGMLTKYMQFPDRQQENAVRNLLQVYDGNIESTRLQEITGLHFCGGLSMTDPSAAEFDPAAGWRVHSIPVTEGTVQDLSLIGQMVNLESLTLIYQQVSSLSDLKNLPKLKALNLAGCRNVQPDTLPELPGLEILHLEHSGAADLTALSSQPNLRKVTVSADMFPLELPQERGFDVVLVK